MNVRNYREKYDEKAIHERMKNNAFAQIKESVYACNSALFTTL